MDRLETLGERLAYARELRGLSQSDLAHLVGMRDPTGISKLENGRQQGSRRIGRIAEVLKTTASWLEHGTGPGPNNALLNRVDCADRRERVNCVTEKTQEDDVTLYQYADPRCDKGPNSGRVAAQEIEALTFSRRIVQKFCSSNESAIGHVQRDNSMSPTINVEDDAIIDTAHIDPVAHSGSIFAIARGSSVMLRRIVGSASGRLLISCDNADKRLYPNEEVSAADAEKLTIIGRLCYSGGGK